MRKAADQGNAKAQAILGILYEQGQGVPQDYSEAAKWYAKAGDSGESLAQFRLGTLYESGQGIPQDYEQAARWYQKAAEQEGAAAEPEDPGSQGNSVVNAQLFLGSLYAQAHQNYEEAAKWYRKAADHGDHDAEVLLGKMYATGQGLPRDYTEAVNWFRKAAMQGDPEAQLSLAAMYAGGQGVARDFVQAYAWANMAAVASADDTQKRANALREKVAPRLNPAQMEQARNLVEQWKAQKIQ